MATWTLGLVSDLHVNAAVTWNSTEFDNMLVRLNARNPDYVAVAGDATNDGTSAQMTLLNNIFLKTGGSSWKSQLIPVPGNHDYRPEATTQNPLLRHWYDYFGTGTYAADNATFTRAAPWYSFDLNGWHFMCMPISRYTGGTDYGQPYYGVDTDVYNWLEADLIANQSKPKVALYHVPRFSTDTNHGNETMVTPLWRLLQKYKCDLVLNGHVHAYQVTKGLKMSETDQTVTVDATGPVQITGSGVESRAVASSMPSTYNYTNSERSVVVVTFTDQTRWDVTYYAVDNGDSLYTYGRETLNTGNPPAGPGIDIYKKYSDGHWHALRGGGDGGNGNELPEVDAISGTTFHEAFGTRVFPSFPGRTGPELLTTAGKKWLTDFQPGFINHLVVPSADANIFNPWGTSLYTDFGIKSHGITVGAPFAEYSTDAWTNMINKIASMGAAVTMVNGQNEVNNSRDPNNPRPSNWAAIAINHQKLLYDKIQVLNETRAGQGLDPILVGNCNIHSGDLTVHDNEAPLVLNNIGGYVDCINYHLYPRGGHPTWELDRMANFYKGYLGSNLPVVCTEAGYFAPSDSYTGGLLPTPVTEWAQDIYIRKMWLEYLIRGYRVSQFELLNDPDSTGNAREKQLGIVNTATVAPSGWSVTPAYTNIMAWNKITGGTAGKVRVKVEYSGTGIRQLVVKHGTGTKLFLWRFVDIETWNPTNDTITRNSIGTTAVTVTSAGNPAPGTVVNVGADVSVVDL